MAKEKVRRLNKEENRLNKIIAERNMAIKNLRLDYSTLKSKVGKKRDEINRLGKVLASLNETRLKLEKRTKEKGESIKSKLTNARNELNQLKTSVSKHRTMEKELSERLSVLQAKYKRAVKRHESIKRVSR